MVLMKLFRVFSSSTCSASTQVYLGLLPRFYRTFLNRAGEDRQNHKDRKADVLSDRLASWRRGTQAVRSIKKVDRKTVEIKLNECQNAFNKFCLILVPFRHLIRLEEHITRNVIPRDSHDKSSSSPSDIPSTSIAESLIPLSTQPGFKSTTQRQRVYSAVRLLNASLTVECSNRVIRGWLRQHWL